MSEIWVTIIVLTVATAVIKGAGPVLVGGRTLPPPAMAVVAVVAPALLAALVVVQTLGAPEGAAFELDARIAGVAAAAIAVSIRAGLLPAVALAAIVTATVRALA